jgi:hypothetical protein
MIPPKLIFDSSSPSGNDTEIHTTNVKFFDAYRKGLKEKMAFGNCWSGASIVWYCPFEIDRLASRYKSVFSIFSNVFHNRKWSGSHTSNQISRISFTLCLFGKCRRTLRGHNLFLTYSIISVLENQNTGLQTKTLNSKVISITRYLLNITQAGTPGVGNSLVSDFHIIVLPSLAKYSNTTRMGMLTIN